MTTVLIINLLAAASLASGCATVINGTTQRVPITSDPPGVRLTVNGTETFVTPISLVLKRSEPHLLEFSLDGYHAETVRLNPAFSTVVAGNIVLGGLIGVGVDSLSGAQYRLVPSVVHVSLRPLNTDAQKYP